MESFAPSRALEAEIKGFCARSQLTPRETDILGILVEGTVRIKDVAARLKLSPNTINNHVNSIFTKTRTSSKSQLLASFLNSVAEELERARFMRQTPQVLMLTSNPQAFSHIATHLRENGFFVCEESRVEDLKVQMEIDLWRFILIDLESVTGGIEPFLGDLQRRMNLISSVILIGARADLKDRMHAMHLGAMDLLALPVDAKELMMNLMCRYIENDADRMRYLTAHSQGVHTCEEGLPIGIDQLGAGGVALASEDLDRVARTRLQPGEFIKLKLKVLMNQGLPEQREQELSAHGQIVWKGNGSRPQTGVRFVHLPQEERAFIAKCTQQVGTKSFIPCHDLGGV